MIKLIKLKKKYSPNLSHNRAKYIYAIPLKVLCGYPIGKLPLGGRNEVLVELIGYSQNLFNLKENIILMFSWI